MKQVFNAYYRPNDSDFARIWNDCTFIFDANVLLDFYQLNKASFRLFADVLDTFRNRLWLPHQVVLEYQDNRINEIIRQSDVYESIDKIFDNAEESLRRVRDLGHVSIDVAAVFDKATSTFIEIRAELKKQREDHPDLLSNDFIRDYLSDLFQDKVGKAYDNARLVKIYEDGDRRFANDIPPGFEDKKKQEIKRFGDLVIQSRYGDLIIWHQIIDFALSNERPKHPIVFVTADKKQDWWWEVKGRTIGPRPELITEMHDKAGIEFYMYQPDQFLEMAVRYRPQLKSKRDTKALIAEVESVSELRREWLTEVTEALRSLGGRAHLNEIYEYVSQSSERDLPKSWQSIIRRTLYNHSSDVTAFLGKDDLFTHLGKGRWGLRTDLV